MKSLKVLHLSDTQLSGSPIRISSLLNERSEGRIESRHIVWHKTFGYRRFAHDLVATSMLQQEIEHLIFEWADVIHYHNRWRRQEIFTYLERPPPKAPSVIQVHSPRDIKERYFSDEIQSKIPIAVIAQYHVRQWPELSFIVPNVVDIDAEENRREISHEMNLVPTVSYAPSNTTCSGWDDKGYDIVAPPLKRLKLGGKIHFQLLSGRPHAEVMAKKREADIGIDEVITGSYHLSSLEYLSLGIPTFANIDSQTERVLKDLTGSDMLPWELASETNFSSRLQHFLKCRLWREQGLKARSWMERHWSPPILVGHYERMYKKIIEDFRP